MIRTKLVLLTYISVTACQLPNHLTDPSRPPDVITVRTVEQNRQALKGRIIRVEGFLQERQRSLVLLQGRRRNAADVEGRDVSWCLDIPPVAPIWIRKRDLENIWRSIRPRTRREGVHVILEGTFDDENIAPVNAEGEVNITVLTDTSDAPPIPGEYLGMGPLRNPRVLRVFRERCAGFGGPNERRAEGNR